MDKQKIIQIELTLEESRNIYNILFDYLNAQGYSKHELYKALKQNNKDLFCYYFEQNAFEFIKKLEPYNNI